MKRVWHYINEGDFPSTDCVCFCRVKWHNNYHYIIANYFTNGDWCCVESGDLITDNVVCWADLDEVLSCIKEAEADQ